MGCLLFYILLVMGACRVTAILDTNKMFRVLDLKYVSFVQWESGLKTRRELILKFY